MGPNRRQVEAVHRLCPRALGKTTPTMTGKLSPARRISWSGEFRSGMEWPERRPKSRPTNGRSRRRDLSAKGTAPPTCRAPVHGHPCLASPRSSPLAPTWRMRSTRPYAVGSIAHIDLCAGAAPLRGSYSTRMIFKGPMDFSSLVRRLFLASRNRLPTLGAWRSLATGELAVTQRPCLPAISWAILCSGVATSDGNRVNLPPDGSRRRQTRRHGEDFG